MKRQAIYGLCVATSAVALMTGCATKQDSSAARARQDSAAGYDAMQAARPRTKIVRSNRERRRRRPT